MEYKINDYITLKLNGVLTEIYINGEMFNTCKRLLVNVDSSNLNDVNEINSIDELKQLIDKNYEHYRFAEDELTPEDEFKGHCSNMEVWVENNYDTRLLDSRLSFPILKKLVKLGDIKARKVFKDEVMKRMASGFNPTQVYLLVETPIIQNLNFEELSVLETYLDFKNYTIKDAYYDILRNKLSYLFSATEKDIDRLNEQNSKEDLLYEEKLLEFIKTKASHRMMRFLMDYRYIHKITPFVLFRNTGVIRNKLESDIIYLKKFESLISKKKKFNRTLELSNIVFENIFGDSTIAFRDNVREIISRLFGFVNNRTFHSVTFIIDSKKKCYYCEKRNYRDITYHKVKISRNADFKLSFLTGGYQRKFFSIYSCEKCLMKKIDFIINGFDKIKDEILKLI